MSNSVGESVFLILMGDCPRHCAVPCDNARAESLDGRTGVEMVINGCGPRSHESRRSRTRTRGSVEICQDDVKTTVRNRGFVCEVTKMRERNQARRLNCINNTPPDPGSHLTSRGPTMQSRIACILRYVQYTNSPYSLCTVCMAD